MIEAISRPLMRVTRHLFAAVAMIAGTLALAPAAQAQVPTIDQAAILKFVDQIRLAQQNIALAQQAYQASTGIRSLGEIFSNPYIREQIPPDVLRLISEGVTASSELSGSLNAIISSNAVVTNPVTDAQNVHARIEQLAATTNVVAQRALQAIAMRQQEIDGLQRQINLTQDPKAIAELQARIQTAMANIQIEQSQMQIFDRYAKSERELLDARLMRIADHWSSSESGPEQ